MESPTGRWVRESHTRAAPSEEAVTKRRPSGLKATDFTSLWCWTAKSSVPSAMSHTRALPSAQAVMTWLPGGLKAAKLTLIGWVSGWPILAPVAASQIWAVLSCDVVTIMRPLALNAAEVTREACFSSRADDLAAMSHTRAVW